MEVNSFNIIGITGGIGYSFFNEIKNKKVKIAGIYNNNNRLASQIQRDYPGIILEKVDLSTPFLPKRMKIPNYEGLFYAVGKSHFGKNLFDFTPQDLQEHMNINVNSLFLILKMLLSYPEASLKKVVVISSIYPSNINSLYHTVKRLQEELLNIVRHFLNSREIGLSIIKTSWVDTNMFKEYVQRTGNVFKKAISPEVVVKYCIREFENDQLFNLKILKD